MFVFFMGIKTFMHFLWASKKKKKKKKNMLFSNSVKIITFIKNYKIEYSVVF